MVAKSDTSERLKDLLRQRVESDRTADVTNITTRECSSDRFRGVQVNIYGPVVPVRPVIAFAAEQDAVAIEELYHCTDSEEPHLGIFLAYLPEQPHPAFI